MGLGSARLPRTQALGHHLTANAAVFAVSVVLASCSTGPLDTPRDGSTDAAIDSALTRDTFIPIDQALSAADASDHADAQPLGDGARTDVAPDPCAGRPDGAHCSATDPGSSLLHCSGGARASSERCANACVIRAGADINNDICQPTPMTDPCSRAASGDGLYCGSPIGGDANTLYRCMSRMTASTTPCPTGCASQPPGVNDRCNPPPMTDPCARAMSGDGLYCGAPIGGDANTLYRCTGGMTASSTPCPTGCAPQPPGVADRCNPPPGACCIRRPPGTFVRGFNACGGGGSHYGIDLGSPLGTPLSAGIAGTVTSVATGNPNCPYSSSTGTCPSSCINNFNYVKIRADCGDPRDASRDLYVYYLHIDRLAAGIGPGVHVNAGDPIAFVGNSGCSSGPHLHIEVVPVARGAAAFLNTCSSVDPATRYCP